jgi:alpha-ketoglutarate-dependent taurine dioxygenase
MPDMHADTGPFSLLRAQVRRYLEAGPRADRRPENADAAELARLVLLTIVPALQRDGMVRLRLVEQPEDHPVEALEDLLRTVSQALGYLLPQSQSEGELAHVQDERADYTQPATRGHRTANALAFHSDRCDVNLLLYVRTAASGGQLSVVSYAEAAELLRAHDPRTLEVLYDGFPFDLRDERIFASLAWHWRPILWEREGATRGHYIRRFIADSQRHPDCPRLTERQLCALDAFDRVLDELRQPHAFDPRPGELVALDNYRVMHARTAFIDAHGEAARRLALRTWVAPYDSAPLPLALHPLAGSCAPGAFRGGVGCGEAYLRRLGSTQRNP